MTHFVSVINAFRLPCNFFACVEVASLRLINILSFNKLLKLPATFSKSVSSKYFFSPISCSITLQK